MDEGGKFDLEGGENSLTNTNGVINWKKANLYSLLDVPNSPMRSQLMEQLESISFYHFRKEAKARNEDRKA